MKILAILNEAKNHMGEREYQTYASWKTACKKAYPGCGFRGDKDIGAATLDGHDVGEWDGAVGCVFNKDPVKESEEGKFVTITKDTSKPASWGFASDLAYVEEQLENVLSFLTNGGGNEEVSEAILTFARKVERYINRTFYVFDDRVSSDDRIDYVIEETKAKYRISASGSNSVSVIADTGSGATTARAREIKAKLMSLAKK